jgi:hypothetical protein
LRAALRFILAAGSHRTHVPAHIGARDAAMRWHVSRSLDSRKKDIALGILIV